MRELVNDDFYLISEIADKMDLILPSPTKEVKGKIINKTQAEYGAELMTLLLKKAYKAKEPINELLANLTGEDVEKIKKMTIKDSVKMVTQLFQKEGFIDFFK
jgi:hypothetical protein